jgi:hypothetical protein
VKVHATVVSYDVCVCTNILYTYIIRVCETFAEEFSRPVSTCVGLVLERLGVLPSPLRVRLLFSGAFPEKNRKVAAIEFSLLQIDQLISIDRSIHLPPR